MSRQRVVASQREDQERKPGLSGGLYKKMDVKARLVPASAFHPAETEFVLPCNYPIPRSLANNSPSLCE